MKLSDILKLNNEIESLNIIQSFLNQPISQYDFEAAASNYLKIAIYNNLDELVLSEGDKFLEKVINNKPTKYRVEIYNFLIDSSINLEKISLARSYIEKRKELLPIIKTYLTIIDELKIKKKLNQDYYDELKKLSVEVLPEKLKNEVLDELLDYYLSKNNLEKAYDMILQIGDLSNDIKYQVKLVEIFYKQGKYEEVVEKSEVILKKINSGLVAAYLISSLTALNKLLRASSLEAEYEDIIDEIDNYDDKLFAYNEIINLYQKIQNNLSVETYEKKIAKLKRKNKEVIKEEQKEVKPKPSIEVKEVITTKRINSSKYLEQFSWIKNWLIESHEIDLKIAFREYLRSIFIKINEKINFEEVILYIDKGYDSNLFNYKKERLYDKKIIKQYLENTIINETLSKKDDVFGKISELNNRLDILTQKEYTNNINYVYSFYISNDIVLVFYLNEEITDPSVYYDLLNGISSIIHSRIIDEKNMINIKKEANYFQDVINNKAIPVRIMTEYQSKYNEKAVQLFNIDSKYHFELFLREIPLEEADKYSVLIKRLLNYPNETKVIEYKYQDLYILEYLFAIKIDNQVSIISFFVDLTNKTLNEKDLTVKASVDQETGLKNKQELINNINKYLDEKVTFVLLELNQELRNIYGNERMHKFFIELSRATEKHFTNYDIYRYDFNQLIVVFNLNDIRTVNKELNEYFQVVNHLKSTILKYEKFKVKAGVLRYPVVTVEKNVDKLYRYLDVALDKAKQSKENDFIHFIFADYEKEVFEQEIIDYLNTAIENKQLNIRFKQIIDMHNNVVWNYESEIYLPTVNINYKYLYTVAKKRKRLVDLELFHLELVCSFLKKLEEETNHLIKITIPISKETFYSQNFNGFIVTTLKKYKIPAEFIRLLCEVDIKDQSSIVKIQELLKLGLSIDTTYIESALSGDFNAVHLNYNKFNNKWKNYFRNINDFLNQNNIALIIKNVDNKQDRELLKNIGIKYIEGEVYQKVDPLNIISKVKENLNG